MLKSMRSRMTVWFVLLLIPFLLATSFFLLKAARDASEAEAQSSLDKLKDKVILAMKSPDWKANGLYALEVAPAFADNHVGIIVRDASNRDPDSNLVFHSTKNPPPLDLRKRSHQEQEKWRFSGGISADKQYRVIVLEPKKPTNKALPNVMFGLSVIVIGAVGAGAWFMVGRVLSPIRALAKQTSQASAEHLSVRLESPSKDAEMRDLVDTLNGLLDRVYETAEIKGRFYAAASHELRTPLQALSGHLELASSRKRTAEEYEAVVKESYIQTRRLIALVQGLLFLHQVDSRTHSSQGTVNLTESCESALEMMTGVILNRNLNLKESFAPDIQIEAVPSHAEVMARNLIENAVKYATEGGEIAITLKVVGENVVLEVVNDFPDNVKIATENVFEPFYRDDTSRNSKTGGNGLGLAICRAVSIANGWEVKLHQEGGKIRAVVNFGPVDSPKDAKAKKKQTATVTRPATA